jgi:hypothetical protein
MGGKDTARATKATAHKDTHTRKTRISWPRHAIVISYVKRRPISKVRAVLEASGESCAATSPRPHIEACPEDAARVAAMRLINYRQDQVLATYTLTSQKLANRASCTRISASFFQKSGFWAVGCAGGCPCLSHLAQVVACDACYQVVSAQNGRFHRDRATRRQDRLWRSSKKVGTAPSDGRGLTGDAHVAQ